MTDKEKEFLTVDTKPEVIRCSYWTRTQKIQKPRTNKTGGVAVAEAVAINRDKLTKRSLRQRKKKGATSWL
jgi:hypothetical protein